MRSPLFVFLLSSSIFLLASADGSTAAPEVKSTPAAAAVEEVKTTPAAEEAKKTDAPAEEVKTTAVPEGEGKTTPAEEKEVKSTAAAKEEEVKTTEAPKVEATPAAEEKKEEASATERPKEKKEEKKEKNKKEKEEEKKEKEEEKKEKEEEKKEEKKGKEEEKTKDTKEVKGEKKEEKKPYFNKDLLSDAVVGEGERKRRRHELIKRVVKKMEKDGAITVEDVEEVIAQVEPALVKKEEKAGKNCTDKPKKLVMPRENDGTFVRPRPSNPDMKILPFDEKKLRILPFPFKSEKETQIGNEIKSGLFEKLRAGRGLINIERIDKIDVTVYTYEKKN